MKSKFKTFELPPIRVWNGEQEYTVHSGYQLVNSSYGPDGTFLTTQRKNTRVKESTFMMRVICAANYDSHLNRDIYEKDIVTFHTKEKKDSLYLGVVVYRQEMYMWGILGVPGYAFYPLHECIVKEAVGSVNTTPELLSDNPQMQSEISSVLQRLAENEMSDLEKEDLAIEGYAALDEQVPGLDGKPVSRKKQTLSVAATVPVNPDVNVSLDDIIGKPSADSNVAANHDSTQPLADTNNPAKPPITDVFVDFDVSELGTTVCSYTLKCGKNEKSGTHAFVKLGGSDNYYITTGTIIALSKLRTPKAVVIHTKYENFNNAINNGLLQIWEKNGWKKSDNSPLALGRELSMLKAEVDRLLGMNCSVTAELQAS